jgi:hypothetical protein
MVTNWYNETKKHLQKNDKMKKTYRVELGNQEGYFTLTDERIIFIKINGFLRKSYKKILDYRYDEIQNIEKTKIRTFDLFTKDGKKYTFWTLGIPAIHIITALNYYKKTAAKPLDESITVTTSQGKSIVGGEMRG